MRCPEECIIEIKARIQCKHQGEHEIEKGEKQEEEKQNRHAR